MSEKGRIVVVANRLPVQRVQQGGSKRWKASPGGLVQALAPVLRQQTGSWVGWSGAPGPAPRPFVHEGVKIRPVALKAAEVESFYDGFSNRTLWPLYHDAVQPPQIQRQWWWPYVDVNRRFAEAAAAVSGRGDTIWVHDYQLQLVPRMIREKQPGARIGFFLHIPFPPDELFAWLPWRRQILEGLLGADVVGFQIQADAEDFARAARRFTTARGTDSDLAFEGRRIRVDAYPISIDAPGQEALAAEPPVVASARELRERLGSSRKIILCVDRLDYTKGIEARLRAFEVMLEKGVFSAADCVLVQVAVPSRETVGEYAATRARVEGLVGRINGQFSEPGRTAVVYFRRSLGKEELAAFYLAADVMLVTPLRDGMNLVCKEYVASRLDDTGVLILSEFAGASAELRRALIVNPYDVDGIAATLEAALMFPPEEARRRMARLRRVVKQNDVFNWAARFLGDLSA